MSLGVTAAGDFVRLGPVPQILVPMQFTSRKIATPEQRLLLAVLEEAVRTYRRHAAATSRRGRALFANVEAWFSSNETGWLFAFESICDALQIDVSYVRSQVAQWRERDGAAFEPRRRLSRRVVFRRATDVTRLCRPPTP